MYIELLRDLFRSHLKNHSLHILTERNPMQKQTSDGIYRWFPFRAGRNKKDTLSYIQYLIQNCMYLFIPVILYRANIRIVFVHASLIQNLNTLTIILRLCRIILKIKIILDIRDPRFETCNVNQFKQYDRIVACSDNILQKLKNLGIAMGRVIYIPIIVEPDIVKNNTDSISECMRKFDLSPRSYLFNASGILDVKGIREGIRLTEEINKNRKEQFVYVVCGKSRDWREEFYAAEKKGVLKYIGEITHIEAVILGVSAYLDVNLSVVDSMPRHSLEVLASQGKVLLPPGVPEFEKYCPESIALLPDWGKTSDQAVRISDGSIANNYPVDMHDIRILAPEYAKLIDSIDTL